MRQKSREGFTERYLTYVSFVYIMKVVKCRRFRWVGHVTGMEHGRYNFKILTGKPIEQGRQGRPKST
jgi:hypothetical protein